MNTFTKKLTAIFRARNTNQCCVGVPSDYVDGDGVTAMMCDPECRCPSCVEQHDWDAQTS